MSKAPLKALARGRLMRQKEVEQVPTGSPSSGHLLETPGRRRATEPSPVTLPGRRPQTAPPQQQQQQQHRAAVSDVAEAEFVLQDIPHQRVTVRVSLVTLVCCSQKTVWAYRTHGLRRLGQTDLLLLLEHSALDAAAAPVDVVQLFAGVLRKTREGSTVGDLDHTVFHAATGFLGSSFIGGVLYFMESGQCFHGLVNPADFGSLLVCRLVHTRELPYLVNSPARLLLRLGLEDSAYPCGLISNRYRPPAFYDPGRSLLSMFREVLPLHDGMVPRLRGCSLTLEAASGCISVSLSGRRLSDLQALLGVYTQDTEGVLAISGEVCQFADAHLVAREYQGGEFETLVARAAVGGGGGGQQQSVTGLSFIALASHLNSPELQGSLAAVVEDGVGVACCRDDMWNLLQSLHKAEDFTLPVDWLFPHDRLGPVKNTAIRFVWRHLPGE